MDTRIRQKDIKSKNTGSHNEKKTVELDTRIVKKMLESKSTFEKYIEYK